ncbi:Hypp3764 [Branchiostoma lanceolatum]|uniref:Hypp3764 protein n=1 Tax=Branchiostoma lanceolatum TaxID=7740 RepID=A0A8K0A1G0_BRALA|nr:Hypp3764 [Branchiostoma lanceolatum]
MPVLPPGWEACKIHGHHTDTEPPPARKFLSTVGLIERGAPGVANRLSWTQRALLVIVESLTLHYSGVISGRDNVSACCVQTCVWIPHHIVGAIQHGEPKGGWNSVCHTPTVCRREGGPGCVDGVWTGATPPSADPVSTRDTSTVFPPDEIRDP